jgi:transposase
VKPHEQLIYGLLLPEQELLAIKKISDMKYLWQIKKENLGAVCLKCATFSQAIYDSRIVKIRDSSFRSKEIILEIKKHRYFCKICKLPFTEALPGILPRKKTTQRLRKEVQWGCIHFTDLKKVEKTYNVSSGFVYTAFYEQLDLELRKSKNAEFGTRVGIDEHSFGRKKGLKRSEFVTMVVDHDRKKVREVVLGKTHELLHRNLENIPGREKVKVVTLDMSDSYKSFAKNFFPNAELVADRFHVERLIQPLLLSKRIEITGDQRKNPVRFLMNRKRKNLECWERTKLDMWLKHHPRMLELYSLKEQIGRFYEIRGHNRAEIAFNKILLRLSAFTEPALKTFYKTLTRWKTEILNFFKFRITNARVEGFNNTAKVIKRMAYGFRSFKNYRLRVLTACS